MNWTYEKCANAKEVARFLGTLFDWQVEHVKIVSTNGMIYKIGYIVFYPLGGES